MAMKAYLEEDTRPVARSRAPRRQLRLPIAGSRATGAEIETLVHNISTTGLLVESTLPMSIGEAFDVHLPHAGSISAKVVWRSGDLLGCQFESPVSEATLSAAQLRSSGESDLPDAAADTDAEYTAETFGACLRRLRSDKRMTPLQLAKKLGVGQATILAWEKDKSRPKEARLNALAKILGVEPSVLHRPNRIVMLQYIVDKARNAIAAAVGTHPDQVRIHIDV
jgi:transcriptional regulator with XRE-family HTH domain